MPFTKLHDKIIKPKIIKKEKPKTLNQLLHLSAKRVIEKQKKKFKQNEIFG